ncbi:SDR family oxidoreductase [Hathewaya massiliensis]|uniref:SDR family oxidoreductase n=1 Tax=Hathewaya massiliensis TaxID=1964382 RepID=UPI00115ABB4A|nr:SDR family oxidoreductase [Hathewaya massiliensis]
MASSNINFPNAFPPQHQNQKPGIEGLMNPKPVYCHDAYENFGDLSGKVAVITGGDSGIGRAVAIAYAKEGADICIIYLNEHDDAKETKKLVEDIGRKCVLISGDVGNEEFCYSSVKKIIEDFGKIDILVNNAGEQYEQQSIIDISKEQLENTFKTNIFSMFFMTKAVLPHLKEGASIINTASVTAYAGNETLIDYSSSKGAVVSFTRSLSLSLGKDKIRVNAVAPGPVWTPLIPSTFTEVDVQKFGTNVPMQRAAQPVELSGAYVFLASNSASFMTGQVIHVNGGKIVNG